MRLLLIAKSVWAHSVVKLRKEFSWFSVEKGAGNVNKLDSRSSL
jgi:hypothetical protein